MTILRCSYVVDTNAVLMGDAGEVSSILLEAVQQVLGVWTDADPSKVISTRINTAMTNYVYKMQWIRPTVSPYIIMRLYGKSGHFLDKQKEEEAALVLSEEGLIPRWLAIFGNGRMEEFIPNTTISAAEFRQESVYEMVAWNLRKLHDTMPIITKRTTIQAHDALWERLEFWRQHAQESLQQLLSKGSLHHHQHYDTIRQIDQWGVLSATVLESLRSSTGHYPKSEVIFGHCDVSSFIHHHHVKYV